MRYILVLICALAFMACTPKVEKSPAQEGKIKIEGTLSVSHLCDSAWIHRYEQKDIKALRERAQVEPAECDVLFFGSSSIRLWKSLKEDFAPLTVVNRGYGGATLRDIHYYYPVIMAHYRPKAFVIFCDNDLREKATVNISVGELFDLYRMLFDRLESDYPGVPVYFLAIKHSQRRETIRERQHIFNVMMREYAALSSQVVYVDTCTPLLTDKGEVDTSLFLEDRIHLNAEGYARWVEVLKPLLIK